MGRKFKLLLLVVLLLTCVLIISLHRVQGEVKTPSKVTSADYLRWQTELKNWVAGVRTMSVARRT